MFKRYKNLIFIFGTILLFFAIFINSNFINLNKLFSLTEDSVKEEDNNFKTDDKKIILQVLDKNYEIIFQENESLFNLMNRLQKENNFSFKYKEYPSLGIFVEEINNKKEENGKYWIYYINDKEGDIGASKYILKKGDIINWVLK